MVHFIWPSSGGFVKFSCVYYSKDNNFIAWFHCTMSWIMKLVVIVDKEIFSNSLLVWFRNLGQQEAHRVYEAFLCFRETFMLQQQGTNLILFFFLPWKIAQIARLWAWGESKHQIQHLTKWAQINGSSEVLYVWSIGRSKSTWAYYIDSIGQLLNDRMHIADGVYLVHYVTFGFSRHPHT